MRETMLGSARWRFSHAKRAPMEAQRAVLRDLLRTNAGTEQSARLGIDGATECEEFRRRVPIQRYGDLEPLVQRAAAGAQRVLSEEPVEMFARTSGSASSPKLVPITRSLHRAYVEAQAFWIDAAKLSGPVLFLGATKNADATSSGIPIGSINGLATPRALGGRFIPIPDEVLATLPFEERLERIIRFARAIDLEMIAAPSPATLINFFRALDRAPHEVWPKLSSVGCWTEGSSRLYVERLRSLVAPARVQDLGYGASEGFFAPRLGGAAGAAPMVHLFFFEFVEEGTDRVRTIEEVEVGARYRSVVTTPAGFYRYDMEDVLEVVAMDGPLPLIRFCHRTGGVSSMTGEKLTEAHVVEAFESAVAERKLSAIDFIAKPIWDERAPYYRFEVELEREIDPTEADELSAAIDRSLSQVNIEYQDRRATRRLDPVRMTILSAGHFAALHQEAIQRGVPEPQVKVLHLSR